MTRDLTAALVEWDIGPEDLVICGGANGADIIIAELASARGATIRLMLPLPEEEFVARSVDRQTSNWLDRFHRLRATSDTRIQHQDGVTRDVFIDNNQWILDSAISEAPEHPGSNSEQPGKELYILLVWDRKSHDSVTSDLLERAKRLWPSLGRGLHLRIVTPGPKRLLALDGGGIRGVLSIEVLARVESLLQAELKRDDSFVLADYFDYIGGTSTGALIAAGLSLGWRVERIQRLYSDNARLMFKKVSWPRRILSLFRTKFHKKSLEAMLKDQFGEKTELGGADLRTLLMVVLHNSNSDSPWPLSSNPSAKYNDRPYSQSNLRVPLWQVVRASTAAPAYFPPELIRFNGSEFVFVDGGITPYNNPALELFLMATLKAYRLEWQTGADQLLLVSIGTGKTPRIFSDLRPRQMNVIHTAKTVPASLMWNVLNEQDLVCRVLGNCRTGAPLDSELGDLHGAHGNITDPLFTYLRYNAELSREGLDRLGLTDIDPKRVAKLDSLKGMEDLKRVGRAVAERVMTEHFEGFISNEL